LNLRKNPAVIDAGVKALYEHGLSTSASRVLAGESCYHKTLESKLACIYNQEAALSFISGHATNVSTIAALVEKNDLIIADQFCHNSIRTGAKLSGATTYYYAHNDCEKLEDVISKQRSKYKRCLIISEGNFSMDGDSPNLNKLCEIRDKYNAWIMIDEAHALGVLGPKGLGSHNEQEIDPANIDIWMGTLSKSLASSGGYIASSQKIINHLRLHAPGFVYSVGLNAPCSAAAETALEILIDNPDLSKQLQKNSNYIYSKLVDNNIDLGTSMGNAIIPILMEAKTVLKASSSLISQGWGIYAITPPAVPINQFRLRLFIRNNHLLKTLDMVVDAISEFHSSTNQ
jgi:8-amino-7-oxononanoate synthase